jgi:hypothetical protein
MRNRYLMELSLVVLIVGLCLTPYAYAQPSLVGKWNFVVVVKNVSISGTITFGPKTFSETTGGHTIAGTYTYAGGVLNYCYMQGCIQYSQAQGGGDGMSGMSDMSMSNNNHIEFHANGIVYHLMR